MPHEGKDVTAVYLKKADGTEVEASEYAKANWQPFQAALTAAPDGGGSGAGGAGGQQQQQQQQQGTSWGGAGGAGGGGETKPLAVSAVDAILAGQPAPRPLHEIGQPVKPEK